MDSGKQGITAVKSGTESSFAGELSKEGVAEEMKKSKRKAYQRGYLEGYQEGIKQAESLWRVAVDALVQQVRPDTVKEIQEVQTEKPDFAVGDIVYTTNGHIVLDIGRVISLEPLQIAARYSTYGSKPPMYGGVDACTWKKTGKTCSAWVWETATIDRKTKDVCDFFGIPFQIVS